MSSTKTLLLTNDYNEEFSEDCNETYVSNNKPVISLEFSKENIRIDSNDDAYLIITITNGDSELYKVFEQIGKLATKEQK